MRPSKQEWAMQLAIVTATRSTCLRRRVGAVLLDARWRVLSTGYNGVAAGLPHCNEGVEQFNPISEELITFPHACQGARAASGTNLDGCEAIHAEQNALLQCASVDLIYTCVTTVSPCMTCVKLLMNTGCRDIIFMEPYAHAGAEGLWSRSSNDRRWVQLDVRGSAIVCRDHRMTP